MRHPIRHPLLSMCTRGLIASILAPALCAAAPASAEIFKCFTKDKTPLYQNFPCEFDSIDAVPSNLRVATTSVVPPPPVATQAKPKVVPPVNVQQPVPQSIQPPAASEPRVGMAQDEIRTLLGEPLEMVQDEPTAGIETWRYVNRSIQFDRTQRVVDSSAW